MFLNKMSLKAKRVSIYKYFIEVNFIAEKKEYIVIFNDQVLGIVVVLEQGCETHFHWGPHQPHDCLQRAEIILGQYKCNYLTVKELKLHSSL